MKYFIICFVLTFSVFSLYAIDIGVQMSSDTSFGIIVYTKHFETALKAQALLEDTGSQYSNSVIKLGAHAGYMFNMKDEKTTLSLGFDGRVGFGLDEINYEQYIDAGARIAFNHRLNKKFMVSGIFFPFWVEVREIEKSDSTSLVAALPSAAVSATFFF